MDKIWDRKSLVIGCCGGNEKNRMTTQNQQKSNAKNIYKKIYIKNTDHIMARQ